MDRSFLPFFFPTNVILVDDDTGFLRHFSLLLDPRLPCRPYSSAHLALQDINAQISMINRFHEFTNVTMVDDVEEQVFVDLNKLHGLLYEPERFSQITVAVIDYDMPAMNGLEVCKRIRHPEIKKILLTGKADEKIAVAAFNAGLIHHYLRKNLNDVEVLLNQAIAKLQRDYFLDITMPIQIVMTDSTGNFLSQTAFQSAFSDLMQKNKIVEFYLWEQPKGILLLDAEGNTSFVFVMSQETLQAHREIALSCDAPAKLLQLIDDRNHVPCFPTADGYYAREHLPDWRRHVYPADTGMGNEHFLCAHVKPAPLSTLASTRIRSFDTYLQNFDTRIVPFR